ncbi:nuclear transport factor 2 family protein [Cellulomonas endophytica]|uniref:nuclear transport factor 2 family protein n=1 Tax=Cellulomonas endophytica TaxID=2494735 RepID=UPI001F0BE852|nr:nuclear transport factor 2 family protein [Cellulomonas endophytica]
MTTTTTDELMRATLLEVFSEGDPERRMAAIRRTYTEDVVFSDAEGRVRGHEALSAKVQEILDGAQGLEFRASGEPYTVQDLGYLAWELGPEGGAPVVRGVDMGLVRDGLLAAVWTVLLR